MRKKNIFKKLAVIAMISACTACATFFVGCNDKEPASSTPPASTEEVKAELTLDKKAVQTSVYETFKLKATAKNTDGNVQWKSLNADIAYVDESGNVTTLGVGETKIVAYIGDVQDECIVTVSATTQVPVISGSNFIDDKVALAVNGSFTPNFTMDFNGTAQENVEFVMESLNASVATVENGTIKAIAEGACQIKVTAKLCGKTLTDVTKVIEVSVVKELDMQLSHNAVSVYAVDELKGTSYGKQLQVVCAVFEMGQKVENPALTWTIDDDSVATVSDSGMVTGVKCGKTEIHVKYGDFVQDIPVTVEYAVAEKAGTTFIAKQSDAPLSGNDIFGEELSITAVYDITEEEDVSKLQPIDVKTTTANGDRVYLFCNETYAVKANVVSADYVLSTKEDVLKVPTFTTEYVVLANDIKDIGVYNEMKVKNTFSGTLDGRGYSISGLNYTKDNCSLFHKTSGATVKNLGLIDVSLNVNQVGGVVYQNVGSLLLENVQIVIKSVKEDIDHFVGGVAACGFQGSVTLRNSFVYFTTGNTDKKGALMGRSNSPVNIENSYVVSNLPLCSPFASNNKQESTINALQNVKYESADAFNEARNASDSTIHLEGFDAKLWNLTKYELPVLNSYDNTDSTVIGIKTEHVDGEIYLNKTAKGNVEIDISAQAMDSVSYVILGGKKITPFTYEAGKITFDGALLADIEIGSVKILYGNDNAGYNRTVILTDSTMISTADELIEFVLTATDGNAKLTKDIDMSGVTFTRSAEQRITFTGTFDGQGYAIKNLTINSDQTGLFHMLGGATVKNVAIIDAVMGSSTSQNGVIAFRAQSGTNVIENVMVSVTLNDSCSYQGGLIGFGFNAAINVTGCVVYVKNEAGGVHGALIARHNAGAVTLTNSYFIAKCNLVSDIASSNGMKDTTNALATPYATAAAFDEAIAGGTVTLDQWQATQWSAMKA